MKHLQLLIVEDSLDDAELLKIHLKRAGYEIKSERVDTAQEVREALKNRDFDIIVSDFQMPGFGGLEAFEILKESGLDIPFILISGTIGEETAVEAMIAGVNDYLMKDKLSRLVPAIERELNEAANRRAKREAELALKKSEERFRELFENANDSIYTTDLEGNFTSVNKKGEELSGFTREEIINKNFVELLSSDSSEKVKKMIQLKLDGIDEATRYELEIITKDNRKKNVEINSKLIYEKGKPIGIQGIARDNTERKKLENDLLESRKRLQLALNSGQLGVWEWNIQTNIVYWSPECYEILKVTDFEGTFEDFQQIIHPDDFSMVMKKVENAFENQSIFETEFRVFSGSGELLWLANSGVAEYDETGKPLRLIGIVNDISKRKAAEEELRKSEEKLRQAQKLESIGRLAGGIAHDFNNMLTAINGYSELSLRMLPEDSPVRNFIEEIKNAGERSAALTHQLLAFSRQQVLEPKILNVNRIISDTNVMLKRLIGEDIQIESDLCEDIGQIKADPGQMSQVIMNLVVNSRDAMPLGGIIKIETKNIFFDDSNK